jgi:LAS superfamily LD-carboxypeptidase LdcB
LVIFYSLFLLISTTACSSGTDSDATFQYAGDTTKEASQNIIQATAEGADTLTKEELLGQIKPADHQDFVRIASQYTDKSDIYLRKEAYEAFQRMAAAAKQAGLSLQIISATRNFADQKSIWEAKWTGNRKVDGQDLSKTIPDPKQRALKILEYSSMPGSSRHHWGTDIDLNALNNDYFASGDGKKLYEWLQTYAAAYDFCQVYTAKGSDRPDGYNEEKWHWSYMPLSSQFLSQYEQKITYRDITGFQGAEAAGLIDIIPRYVQGIAPACKDWRE